MKPQKVLVVDDDANVREFLSRTLKRAGFSVLTASDGCEVAELVATTAIDLLVLDLQMPGMNGWEVIRSVRDQLNAAQLRGRAHPKIVVVSGRDEDETAAFVRRLGADAFLRKPLWGQQLVRTIRSVLAAAPPSAA